MGGDFLKILSSCAGIAFPLNTSFLEAIRKATCWAGREWKSLEPGEGEGSPSDNKNRKETVTSDIPPVCAWAFQDGSSLIGGRVRVETKTFTFKIFLEGKVQC